MDMFNFFSKMKPENMDLNAVFDVHAKNVQTFLNAQTTAAQVLESTARIQANYMQNMLNDMRRFMENAGTPFGNGDAKQEGAKKAKSTKQEDVIAEPFKKAFSAAQEQSEKMGEVWEASSRKMMDVMAANVRRSAENIKEFQRKMYNVAGNK